MDKYCSSLADAPWLIVKYFFKKKTPNNVFKQKYNYYKGHLFHF